MLGYRTVSVGQPTHFVKGLNLKKNLDSLYEHKISTLPCKCEIQAVILTSGQDLSIRLPLCPFSDDSISSSRGAAWFPHNFWNILTQQSYS